MTRIEKSLWREKNALVYPIEIIFFGFPYDFDAITCFQQTTALACVSLKKSEKPSFKEENEI